MVVEMLVVLLMVVQETHPQLVLLKEIMEDQETIQEELVVAVVLQQLVLTHLEVTLEEQEQLD